MDKKKISNIQNGLASNSWSVFMSGIVLPSNFSARYATAGTEKANAARTSLSRSLRRLKERGLISDSIRMTFQGIGIAKELSAKWARRI
jgi:hypothetical protein